MRKYEAIIVFNPELNEGQIKEALAKIEELVSFAGGSDTIVESWGKKEIAYYVGKHKFGHFRCVFFSSSNGGIVAQLISHLRLSDAVIKFQVHRVVERRKKIKAAPISAGRAGRGDESHGATA
jgi:ribosomal protein S6